MSNPTPYPFSPKDLHEIREDYLYGLAKVALHNASLKDRDEAVVFFEGMKRGADAMLDAWGIYRDSVQVVGCMDTPITDVHARFADICTLLMDENYPVPPAKMSKNP